MGSLQWSAVRLDETDAKGVLDIVESTGTVRWPMIVYDEVLAGRDSNGPVLATTKVGARSIALDIPRVSEVTRRFGGGGDTTW